jgi:hypothetical protein
MSLKSHFINLLIRILSTCMCEAASCGQKGVEGGVSKTPPYRVCYLEQREGEAVSIEGRPGDGYSEGCEVEAEKVQLRPG